MRRRPLLHQHRGQPLVPGLRRAARGQPDHLLVSDHGSRPRHGQFRLSDRRALPVRGRLFRELPERQDQQANRHHHPGRRGHGIGPNPERSARWSAGPRLQPVSAASPRWMTRPSAGQDLRQESAVVDADLLGDHAVDQIVHAQDQIAVGLGIDAGIDHLVGVEVEQLDLVVGEPLFEGRGRVEIIRRIAARELVAAVVDEADMARRVGTGAAIAVAEVWAIPAQPGPQRLRPAPSVTGPCG
jgi:hypothetical protein